MSALRFESLHNHTTTSDGILTYPELLRTAEKHGFGTIAFTDHDSLPSAQTLEQLDTYTGPVRWLVGIEVSSALPKELESKPTSSFHIIGLFVNPTNQALQAHCAKAQHARRERMQRIVTNLTTHGFSISVEDCLRESGGESVGRPHITAALLAHQDNHTRLRDIAAEYEAAAAHNPAMQEQYGAFVARAQKRGISEYVYRLLLSDDAYAQDVYVDYLYSTDMDESVALIRDAGGIAIVAHWWTVQHKIPLTMLRTFLDEKRIDGVEVIGGAAQEAADCIVQLEELVARTNCIASVGVDAHTPEHFTRFLSMDDRAEKTPGTLAAILDRTRPDTTYSNL